jgi:hypothetical protein
MSALFRASALDAHLSLSPAKNIHLCLSSPCLSRACLGKMFAFTFKKRRKKYVSRTDCNLRIRIVACRNNYRFLYKNASLFWVLLSLCLSRACLGKIIVFSIQYTKLAPKTYRGLLGPRRGKCSPRDLPPSLPPRRIPILLLLLLLLATALQLQLQLQLRLRLRPLLVRGELRLALAPALAQAQARPRALVPTPALTLALALAAARASRTVRGSCSRCCTCSVQY